MVHSQANRIGRRELSRTDMSNLHLRVLLRLTSPGKKNQFVLLRGIQNKAKTCVVTLGMYQSALPAAQWKAF